MKKLKVFAVLFLVTLLLYVLVRQDLGAARREAAALLAGINQGQVPADLVPAVESWARVLVEFKPDKLEIVSLQPALFSKVKAVLAIGAAGKTARAELALERVGKDWQVTEAPEASLAVGLEDDLPHLVLQAQGQEILARPLTPWGEDKLLTLAGGAMEWQEGGWLEPQPWFKSFVGGEKKPLVVGMRGVQLFGWGDGLAAALSPSFIPDTIRVNISTAEFKSIYHSSVTLEYAGNWQMQEAVTGYSRDLAPGALTVSVSGEGLQVMGRGWSGVYRHRLIFTPGGEGEMAIASITRANGIPAYQGSLEIAPGEEGLLVVNELPLEEYLCYVLPSEMPPSFGTGAMAAQAIAARTFAVGSIYASSWQATSAHVVDSVLSQVYNNIGVNPVARAGVEATRGLIASALGGPADIRYFSTSWGYTASCEEVWSGSPVPWLVSQPQFPGPLPEPKGEEAFRELLFNPPPEAYDAQSPWFRWHFTVDAGQLANTIRAGLAGVAKESPENVKVLEGDKFVQVTVVPPDPLGQLLDLIPLERGAGGILKEVEIRGSLGVWRISREYYIRRLLKPEGPGGPVPLYRNDGSILQGFSLLPSAFALWDKEGAGEGLSALTFWGGGYGHGVGMSQYGAKALGEMGRTGEEIIRHYFPGVELEDIYGR